MTPNEERQRFADESWEQRDRFHRNMEAMRAEDAAQASSPVIRFLADLPSAHSVDPIKAVSEINRREPNEA